MLNFILGLVLGFVAGVVMMCILFVAREKKSPIIRKDRGLGQGSCVSILCS
jgi:hypothetical protein